MRPARGLIVNGHVPVKIEKGEAPLKRSGKAITIDGAFSEAYGDHGYTLVLEADRTFLGHAPSLRVGRGGGARRRGHHPDHRRGAASGTAPRRVADTERGARDPGRDRPARAPGRRPTGRTRCVKAKKDGPDRPNPA